MPTAPHFLFVSVYGAGQPFSQSTFKSTTTILCPRRNNMNNNLITMAKDEPRTKGFGKPSEPAKPDTSVYSKRREAASQRYDEMAAKGMPEYSVWFRLKKGGVENDEEQMPWLPVGAIAVPRSSQVADALFEPKTEEDLIKGAIRLYPKLQNEPRENIEFGYQLREFDDEPIRIAQRTVKTGFQATLRNFFRRLQNPLNISS